MKKSTNPNNLSLEEWMTKEYDLLVERYKKLILALRECGVLKVYQFRAGLERMSKDEARDVIERASDHWGRIAVEEAAKQVDPWGLRGFVSDAEKQIEGQQK